MNFEFCRVSQIQAMIYQFKQSNIDLCLVFILEVQYFVSRDAID